MTALRSATATGFSKRWPKAPTVRAALAIRCVRGRRCAS
jgi:hypothetical protein